MRAERKVSVTFEFPSVDAATGWFEEIQRCNRTLTEFLATPGPLARRT